MIPFYITTFNSPDLCNRLIRSLDDLIYSRRYNFIISDQSNEEFLETYKRLADRWDFEYVHYENKGATQAKLSVLDHAIESGAEFCCQMSEDFIRNYENNVVVSGSDSFDTDSLMILKTNPEIHVVKWNALTSHNGCMSYLYHNPSGKQIYTVQKDVKLPFLTGDVCFSNWPSAWRVKGVQAIREKAKLWTPPNEYHKHRSVESAGEWDVSMNSFGHAACLIARPFIHPDRIKDTSSLP